MKAFSYFLVKKTIHLILVMHVLVRFFPFPCSQHRVCLPLGAPQATPSLLSLLPFKSDSEPIRARQWNTAATCHRRPMARAQASATSLDRSWANSHTHTHREREREMWVSSSVFPKSHNYHIRPNGLLLFSQLLFHSYFVGSPYLTTTFENPTTQLNTP
jgi:hypothetical protein